MSNLEYFNYEGYGQTTAKQNFWYSQAVQVGDVIECSGQGGWDRITEEIPKDIEKEIEQAFDNVEAALTTAGSKGWEDVFSLTSHHMPINDETMGIMVRLLKKYCPNHQPIWTALGVPALARTDMRVEIEVRAYSPKK
ncbi:hypothetical protein SS1G_14046 [Sclerotinia sclerotiorum 1980 UF-70]|uniref:Uncharacterized protein n=2 Tax=Sclerotinia sclerotiorum (strain ATCC 18683 / 1980 / Ss-1) TaxID=665079 RepID=A7F8W5_SCLS1|nr:hypothetical protein SS1G_14046 [Sclerotinia sclerotiorum 1980 UF-70]APA13146.1 hypothetical protein sscle_10g079160 [Sclerotinia sclerotiorum 1980 UF-70]EDN99186.1 hypothetical protein SS1G_14046 [Sclerotinia sclerotiorum 1980 UF-70]